MSRGLILMYHLIDAPRSAQEHRFCTPPEDFAPQMDHVKQHFTPVTLSEMLAGLAGRRPLPERAIHVTFDDGFVGVLEHAAPILADRAVPATLFAVSARLGRHNDWMTGRGFPARPLLTASQLRELASGGFEIGSHTATHARLTEIDGERIATEVGDSKRSLEDELGREVRYFAYPYGLHDQAARGAVVKAGYAAACSTVSGFNRPGQDVFGLRRIDVFGTDRLWQFRQKLRFGRNESSRLFALRYYAERLRVRLLPH